MSIPMPRPAPVTNQTFGSVMRDVPSRTLFGPPVGCGAPCWGVGRMSDLAGGAQQDFVDREVPGAADDERDDVCDVACGDLGVVVELLDALAGLAVCDVVRELGGDHAGFDQGDADVGQQLLAQGLRPAVEAPLGCRVDAVAGPCGAPGN